MKKKESEKLVKFFPKQQKLSSPTKDDGKEIIM